MYAGHVSVVRAVANNIVPGTKNNIIRNYLFMMTLN